ncbi:MAG: hypothetical protein Q8O95_02925 [bacterium]|nr:hypothetical protein [bacterium]
MKIKQSNHIIVLVLVSAGVVFWLGRLSVQYQLTAQVPPIQTVADINPKVPLVNITSIEDALVHGTVNNRRIRITSGDQVAVPDTGNQFQLNIEHLGYLGEKRPIEIHQVPEWAQFVASKNGKYAYEIDDRSAKQLTVMNRVYFYTQQEAVEAGYEIRVR